MNRTASYKRHLIEDLRDPKEAVAYLNAALEAGDREAFLLALAHFLEAQDSVTGAARRADIHRVSLHKMLSSKGNPRAENLLKLFRIAGLRFTYRPPKPARRSRN